MSANSEAGMGEKAGGPGVSATGAASAGGAATGRDVTNASRHDASENPSIVLATTVLTALISQGVRWVAYCPGSRDAPFGYALANLERSGRVRTAVFSDERSAGFWAVGAAKLHHEPVAVVTTSGTAVAELHPALEEAWFQSLPIIALTADRPHELRGVGASQTTHQVGIFGRSVVASDEFPADFSCDAGALARVRGRVRRIVAASRGFLGHAGPVHLNVAFREPLVPVAGSSVRCGVQASSCGMQEISPSQILQPSSIIESRVRHPKWEDVVNAGLRTLVVAGDGADPAVAAAAARRGIPVIAEPSSNVTGVETWIPYQQWIVPQLGRNVEQIVVTGRPTLSRPITQLLGQAEIRKVVVATHPEWVDVHETADVVVEGLADGAGLADGSSGSTDPSPSSWLQTWRAAASAVDEVLGDSTVVADDLTLLSACRTVWRGRDSSLLWLGASNTVRGFDLAANRPGRADVYSNRGLAGIDGTIASALGLAMASGRPVRAIMGDMTFAYDLPTLAQRPESPGSSSPDIQVVVLDDGGGSIFASLEHGGADPAVYERFFAAAPQADPVAAAQACGWEARKIETLAELNEALAEPVSGRSLLHLKIERPTAQLDAARASATAAISEAVPRS